jgi:hypothetical protein
MRLFKILSKYIISFIVNGSIALAIAYTIWAYQYKTNEAQLYSLRIVKEANAYGDTLYSVQRLIPFKSDNPFWSFNHWDIVSSSKWYDRAIQGLENEVVRSEEYRKELYKTVK